MRAMLLLPLVSLSLRWRGFRATQATLQSFLSITRSENERTAPPDAVTLTARLVNSADRHGLVHATCLAKSLTLWWLLERQGVDAQLRVGIRKDNEKFQAHAWVERDGVALNEPDEHHLHYAMFDAAFSALPLDKS